MAVVATIEGTFYDIPDSELDKYKVPAEQAKALMEEAGEKLPQNPGQQPGGQGQGGGGGGSQPQILVQFISQGFVATQQMQPRAAPAEGEQETVDPQWYRYRYHYWHWINWSNWANWYNWY